MQKSARPAVVMGLCLLATVVSAYLTALHLRHLSTGAPSLCNFGATFNCDVVNTSAYSRLFGIPISHLGTVFYLTMTVLGGVALARPTLRPRLHGYLFLGALFSVGYSLFLVAVSWSLHAVCMFCASLYVINLSLFGVLAWGGLAALRRLGSGFGDDLRGFFHSKAVPWAIAFFAAAGVAILGVRDAAQSARKKAETKLEALSGPQRMVLEAGAPTIGPENAPVTLVEISDFECPFCQRASETVAELRQRYPNELRLVFRNFPLDQACNPLLKRQIHENACAAARAAMCAAEQGQFFPYAERLFQNGTEAADLLTHAKTLKLDESSFTACQSAPSTATRVEKDIALCSKLGVTAVPVFFVNGRKLAGAQPLEAFVALIDEELKARR